MTAWRERGVLGRIRENGRGAWEDFWGDGCFGCGIVSCSYVYVSKQLRPHSLNMCSLLYASYISVSKHNLRMPRMCSGYCLGSERQQGFVCCLFYSLRKEHLGLELLSWSSQGFVCRDMHIEPSGQGSGFIWSVVWLLWKKFRAELEFQILEWRDNKWKNCLCSPVVFWHAAIKHWC